MFLKGIVMKFYFDKNACLAHLDFKNSKNWSWLIESKLFVFPDGLTFNLDLRIELLFLANVHTVYSDQGERSFYVTGVVFIFDWENICLLLRCFIEILLFQYGQKIILHNSWMLALLRNRLKSPGIICRRARKNPL